MGAKPVSLRIKSASVNGVIENVHDKVKSRCNIISKLAGTDWGAPAPVLRISAITLVYSVAEYCVPLWGRCAHVQHIDTQLNIAMRTISGTLRPTNINWLPVLSNIEPPQIRRDHATLQEYKKAQQLTDRVPIKEILREPPMSRISPAFRDRGCTTCECKSSGAGDMGAVMDSRDTTRT